ncbi:hypothetical protein TRFO_22221 [Tritrichomonas foetus]|uniref:ATPase n=1 Tax=Tritrichomonas foetus TaxID=1144522 RepID=A0A1J4KDC8_9EUKA|nr:hypothetical protein TRFO_22221 [Tritrichomonas foetus]|eukprot:OHT08986.1 hypothetical protein TRFO_22221 [Tritrichomonas foetus]
MNIKTFSKQNPMLCFLVFALRVQVLTQIPKPQLNLSDLFKTKFKVDGRHFDSQIILRDIPPAFNTKDRLLCTQFMKYPDLEFYRNLNIHNRQIFLDTFPGSSFLSNFLRAKIAQTNLLAEYYITADKQFDANGNQFEKINLNDIPADISYYLLNTSFPLYVLSTDSDPKQLSSALKCSPPSKIMNFIFLAQMLVLSYAFVLLLSFILKQDEAKNRSKRFYSLTSEFIPFCYPKHNKNGLTITFKGKLMKPIIKGLNLVVPYEIAVSDQHFSDKIILHENENSPVSEFEAETNKAKLNTPMKIGKESINIIFRAPNNSLQNSEQIEKVDKLGNHRQYQNNERIQKLKYENFDFDPLMTEFCHMYLQSSLQSLLLSNSNASTIDFIRFILKTFDLCSLIFYKIANDKLDLLFQEVRDSNQKCHFTKEELLSFPKTALTEKSTIYLKDGYKYFISNVEFGNQCFMMIISLKDNVVHIMGIEDYFCRFCILSLAYKYFTTTQNCNELSCKNYLSMLQLSHAFTATEYFEDMTRLSAIGELEESDIVKSFNAEQKKKFNSDLMKLKKNGEAFSQQQYRVEIDNNVKWYSVTSRMSFDSYYDRNVIFVLFEEVTHLHKLESQIKETFQDLSLASKLLGLHKFSQKKDGTIQLSNSGLLKELGYSENASRNLMEYVSVEDRDRILHLKEAETCTLRLMNKTGEYQWWTVICTSAQPGKLKGFSFSVQELTELQSKVKSTRDCFEIGSSTNAFAFWAINLDPSEPPHSVFMTKKYEYLLKNTHPDFHDLLELDKLKNIEAPVTLEVQLRLDTMIKYIWFSLTLIPMGGRQLLCFAFNIDERKKTHDLLLQTQQLLELAFTYSDAKMWAFEDRYDSVITSDDDQMIMDWSTLQHNLAPEFHEKVKTAFKNALSGNDKLEIEVPFFFDSLHWLLMRGIRIDDHKLVGICIDTTAIKETSQELEKQKAAAEEASMAKSMFLANMSHEIRTPLNGICGLLEILSSSELTAEQTELTDCIQSSFMELLELLNDTLDLAKLESHKVIKLSVKFDASEVISSLQDSIFLRKKKPGFSFRMFMEANSPILYSGDPHCFVRIVTNILSNSTKNTEKGFIDIIIKDEDGLVVEVVDTGCGINEKRLQSIQEHFDHGEMMAVYENTCVGVGLSLVTEMIRFMKGSITVSSEIGVGTKFTFRVPFEPIYYPIAVSKKRNSVLKILISKIDSKVSELIENFAQFYGFTQIEKTDKEPIESGQSFNILFIDQDNLINEQIDSIPTTVKIGLLMSIEPKESSLPHNIEPFVKPLKPNLLRDFLVKVGFGRQVEKPAFCRSGSVQADLGHPIRVLAVDDNSTNQLVIKKMLKKLGCSFEVVSNGKEAVNIVQQEKFDLVLMDQFMPILDGPQATEEIRKIGGYLATLPIIAMTASILQEDEEKCRRAGMNAFICKPVTLKSLSKVLDQYCRHSL